MKIIRPEQPIKKKEENLTLIIDEHECTPVTKEEMEFEYHSEEKTTKTIEDVMNEVLQENSNNVSFTVILTKRQYDLYLKKGGEAWIKRVITGQKIKRVTRKA
jgi:hypothetical protein